MANLFSTLYVGRLSIADLFSLNKSTIDIAIPLKESLGDLPKAILTQLESRNNAMGNQMNRASKSVLTSKLVEMDDDRDDRFAEIKRNVTTVQKGRDASRKAAADKLRIFFGPYWDASSKAMNTQTGIFFEMYEKYNESDSLKADAAAIGINVMMTELETANVDFNSLYNTRNEQEAAHEGPSATSLKTDVIKSYEQFCTAIEQATSFTPSEVLNSLFSQMDELRKKYAVLVNMKDKEEEAVGE